MRVLTRVEFYLYLRCERCRHLWSITKPNVAALMNDPRTHVYICGLKGMESGVDEAFADVCRGAAIDWAPLKAAMREDGRYHVETY